MVAGLWSYGTITPNEHLLVLMPRIRPAVLKPPVIFCPQAGGQASYFRDGISSSSMHGRARFARQVAEAGHVCLAGDFGGALTFGNPTLQARILAAWNWLQTQPMVKPGPAIMFGTSMGNISAVNFARANPEKVLGIISAFGAVDITGAYLTNDTGFRAAIGTAWGVTYPTPLPAAADPMNNVSEMTGIPWRGWYAQDDPLVDPLDSEAFADAMPDGIVYNTGFQGHDDDVIFAGWNAMFAQIEAWS